MAWRTRCDAVFGNSLHLPLQTIKLSRASTWNEILAIFAYAFLHCCQLRCQLNLEHSQVTKDRNQTVNGFRLWAMHDTRVAVEKRSYSGSIKIPKRNVLFL